jgi:hypothetical protein
MNKHRIVVSAENNPYAGWMVKLFYFSCISRLDHSPIIIVHDSGQEWHSDFLDLVRYGAFVRGAPSYRVTGAGDDYMVRNTAGTLIHSAYLCRPDEYIVLCDPDMIFVRHPRFPTALSGDYVSYMNYNRERVRNAAQQMNIEFDLINMREQELRCVGVPYVIPVTDAPRLAATWLEALDALAPREWEDMMYAYGLAALKLGIGITQTNFVSFNGNPDALLKGDVIHYCYGDDRWSKRQYVREEQASLVWKPCVEAYPQTVLGEILLQINEARRFYYSVL